MSEWVRVPAHAVNQPVSEKFGRVEITLLMSPYDVPRAIRGDYDNARKKFIITFKYLATEEVEEDQQNKFITLLVGRKSARLYGIEVDVDKLHVAEVALRVRVPEVIFGALDRLVQSPPRLQRRDNYQAAKNAILQTRQKVFEALPPAA
jgi:hypothetical protein